MTNLEDRSNEAPVKSAAASVVFPPNGTLRPKRRWKSWSTVSEAEMPSLESPPSPAPEQSFQHYRFKKSAQPHRIYPEVISQFGSARSEVSAIEMAQQAINLVRSFSFR